MDFMNKVQTDLLKSGIESGSSEPPRYWFSTGNYVLNKLISGSFFRGTPQGRIICYTGPSGAGKSFLICNALREAQRKGAYIVVLDSENALDDEFVSKIGVNVNDGYTYYDVDTIPKTNQIASKIIQGYKKEYGSDPDAPPLVIAIDSLDMLMTETEVKHFDAGKSKGDQGQRNKQLKAMLRGFVQAVKHPNISMLVTSQVYRNQDVTNGEGVWVVSDATKFSLSQIVLLTKLKLRVGEKKLVEGIRMKCEGYKTRFTKPFQSVTIEVPYNTGMDPYNGLQDVAVELGVLERKGSWYHFGDTKFNGKGNLPKQTYVDDVLTACEAKRELYIEAVLDDDDEIDLTAGPSAKSQRKAKADSK